jgi:hypothetical protein
MCACLSLIVVFAARIVLMLIKVACVIWQERARAAAQCTRMETAASSGTMLCGRRANGDILLLIPETVRDPDVLHRHPSRGSADDDFHQPVQSPEPRLNN